MRVGGDVSRTLRRGLLLCAIVACRRADARARPRPSDPRTAAYVGYEYDAVTPHHTLPNGVLYSGGALIGNPSDRPMYAIDQMSHDGTDMLWLLHSIGVAGRHTRWHVDDVLDVPSLRTGEAMIPDASCAIHGTGDPEVVAIVVQTNTEQYTQIVRAWRANRSARAFQPIDTAGVSCANTGYDAED